ncbi:uncharacterized protein ACA1_212820 [Acanthamoeba castellanii str. Neff]|uniref:Uncharacterized protein n=1 Tax=Acanthamoeba castellanii (strain ATCC 30010 / Neff) TaxID=1257118 RepID=L8GSC6_ACACF|nr:uncharacterized protein ACA1_212820 [Acanthamoeba castellanii str. Neff]ELR15026.1 hypothetical protein ACA1_212820 [Acanthamoeba castellanii str. Neff]
METRKQHPTSARGVGRVSDLVAPPQPTSEGAAETHSPVAWDELLHASEPCASGINVLWILSNPHDTWGSSLWSGWEIAEAITKYFPDVVCLPLSEYQITAKSDEQLLDTFIEAGQRKEKRSLDLCLFLKIESVADHLLKRCLEMGAARAILWVDGHPHLLRSKTDGRAETAKSPFDYHIQVNTIPAQHYEGAMTGTQWMIPQHNSNLHGLRHNASAPVRVIGWQGSKMNRMAPLIRDTITAWATERGMEFREFFYKGTPASREYLLEERDQAFRDTVDAVDIMPNARNIFPLSMGIPTILFPYVSYIEELRWAHYPGFASSLPELMRWLEILTTNTHARESLSRLGIQFTEHLSLDRIARKWAFHLRTALCGRKPSTPPPPEVPQPAPSPS